MGNSTSKKVLTGAEIIWECLLQEKVSVIFGYPGGAILPAYDALTKYKDQIHHVLTRHEQGATHMADGYARATGLPGVMIAGQNGPGATNLITGVAQAAAAFSPVVSIAGAVSSEDVGKNAFQEIDQQALFEPITKKTWTINQTDKIPEIFHDAFKLALTPRCGPVHINLPRDILSVNTNFV